MDIQCAIFVYNERNGEILKRTKKSIYKCQDRSILHKFMKQEGYSRIDLSSFLNISMITLDKYMNNPRLFTIGQVRIMAEYTDVDLFFIIDLIDQQYHVNKIKNKRNN